MAKQLVQLNNTSRTEYVWIQDSSSSVGAGLTGLTYLSAGLSLTYVVERGTAGSLGLANLTSASVAWSSGGFVAVDTALMPGLYRLDIPNVVFQTADKAVVMLKGATNMVPVVLEYQIVGFNPDDAVRLGLTAIPNVAQGTSGSLPTGNASGQVTVLGTASGAITSSSFAAGAINAAAIATGAVDADALASDATAEIADAILARNLDSSGNEASTSSSGRTVRNALRILRNKIDATTGTQLDVYNEADTTVIWSQPITTSVTADPIVKVGT